MEQIKLNTSKRTGKRTIALVGFSPAHRHEAPWDDPDTEIWTLNEFHVYWPGHPWRRKAADQFIQRWDRAFQLHTEDDFRRANHTVPCHFAWLLTQDGSKPIYMQDHYDYIPASVKFPLEEIEEMHGGLAIRGPDDEDIFYCTSTMGFMLMLAIYFTDVERIEIYGADMMADTEYIHQKGSTEYWVGFANGKGLLAWLPEHSGMMDAPLYGYGVSQMIGRGTIQLRAVALETAYKKAFEAASQIGGNREVITTQFKEANEEYQNAGDPELRKVYLEAEAALIASIDPDLIEHVQKLQREMHQLLEAHIKAVNYVNSMGGRKTEATDILQWIDMKHPEFFNPDEIESKIEFGVKRKKISDIVYGSAIETEDVTDDEAFTQEETEE